MEEGEGEGGKLEEVCQLHHDGMARWSVSHDGLFIMPPFFSLVWSPTPSPLQIATVDEKHANLWKLDGSSTKVSLIYQCGIILHPYGSFMLVYNWTARVVVMDIRVLVGILITTTVSCYSPVMQHSTAGTYALTSMV